jgi:ABC-2 type transport system permease protein
MSSTIGHIIRKEFTQTFRDRRMLVPIFIAPIIQLILFGYAVTTDIQHISLAVLDLDRTQESRSLISAFGSSTYFDLNYELGTEGEIDPLLDRGRAKAVLVIPEHFGGYLRAGARASLQVILDGTDSNSATIIQSYMSLAIALFSEKNIPELVLQNRAGFIIPQPRIWYNPELRSSLYMVPGVICLILLLTTLMLTAMAITKEREMGTLEQLIVSPIRPLELMLGKTIPFIIIGFVDILLVVLAGKIIFDVPLRGIPLLLGVAFLFILTTLSLGLFISTVSRTQQQAMMTAFFVIMPAMLLSGIFSPIESMPRPIQYITLLNPLRHFSRCVRGILLKGNGVASLWPQILALFLFGVMAIILSSLRFKKRLE